MVKLNITLPKNFLDEEVRCGYTVTRKMKEVWAIELDIMMEIFRVCNKYDIPIQANGGTILGAVRHGGFIPWDDDIDLEMTRDNYNKLCEIAPMEFKEPYFFQTEYTDHGTLRGHIQVRRSDTTAILTSEKDCHYSFNQGIFVDIFPYDKLPDDLEKRKQLLSKVTHYQRMAFLIRSHGNKNSILWSQSVLKKMRNTFIYPVCNIAHRLKVDSFFYKKMEKCASSYNEEQCEMMGPITFDAFREKGYRKSDSFNQVIFLPFEFCTIPVCKNYDEVLKNNYGDYRRFEMGASYHGEIFFDVNKSYRDYLV